MLLSDKTNAQSNHSLRKMIRIAALNDSSSEDETTTLTTGGIKVTSEAQENAAYALYTKALGLEKRNQLNDALVLFTELLQSDFLNKGKKDDESLAPSAALKFSALKNLSHVYSQLGRPEDAIETLLQAIEIDFTDVSVCYKLGCLAKKVGHYMLAMRAFTRSMELNPQHWPSLHNLLTLLYVLNNYEVCLFHIASSLKRDSGYMKGLVLRKYIIIEQPSLWLQYKHFFSDCPMNEVEEYTNTLTSEEEEEVMREAREMRRKHREFTKPQDTPAVKLDLPEYSWEALGQRLLQLFDYMNDDPDLNPLVHVQMTVADTIKGSADVFDYPVCKLDKAVRMDTEEIPPLPLSDSCASSPVSTTPNVVIRRPTLEMSDSCCSTPQLIDDHSQMSLLSITAASEASEMSDIEDVMKDILTKLGEPESNPVTDDDVIVKQMLDGIVSKVCEQLEAGSSSHTPVAPSRSDHLYAKQPQSGTSTPTRSSKRSKRSLLAAEMQHAEKRRSSRVKQPTKQVSVVEKSEDHKDVLEKLIPRCLLEEKTAEHGYNAVKPECMDSSIDQSFDMHSATKKETRQIESQESEIKDFLIKTSDNIGVISLMREWMHVMVDKRDCKWSQELTNLYIKMFEINQESFERPNIFLENNIEAYAMLTLLWMEMKVEHLSSTVASHFDIENMHYGPLGLRFRKELTYWDMILGSKTKLPSYCREYTLRFYWMAAKFYNASGQSIKAIHSYSKLADFIKEEQASSDVPAISLQLTNSAIDDTISLKTVTDQLDSLERTQKLEELQTFLETKEYSKVVELLAPTFNQPLKKRKTELRHSQLSIFLQTAPKLEKSDGNTLVSMLEEALHECFYHSKLEPEKWMEVTNSCFLLLSSFIERGDMLPHTKLVRLSRSCLNLISQYTSHQGPANQKKDDSEVPHPVQTVMPWIMLHQLMVQYEKSEADSGSTAEEPVELPASCKLLIEAHSYLGEHGLCTIMEGKLLRHLARYLIHIQSKNESFDQLIEATQNLQQCFYCLYGHPNKKVKSKNLRDHGAPMVNLQWEDAEMLFTYYKPSSLPEFDSYKSSTISAEQESLFRRIAAAVPSHLKPGSLVEEQLDAYLTDQIDNKELDKRLRIQQIKDSTCLQIFYLLADYYFKNKEPLKAVKHYMQDLTYNISRFDSWAGMSLAKSSKLESRLNVMERQSFDGAFQKLAVSTMQAYARSLYLNKQNSKLWIEYAVAAYQLHSHASRIIKSRNLELSQPEIDAVIELKRSMLVKARSCYIEAQKSEDESFEEAWLYHYMLGKISEKSKEDPAVYLDHYFKATVCLDEEGANYPQRISYMYNPPYLAVEALEIYYRLHTVILKNLQRSYSPSNYSLYQQIIAKMKDSPFVTASSPPPQSTSSKRRRDEGSTEKPPTGKRLKADADMSALAQPGRDTVCLAFDEATTIKQIMDDILTSIESDVTYPTTQLIVRQTFDATLDKLQAREDEEIRQVAKECLDELLDGVMMQEALTRRGGSNVSVLSDNSMSQISQPMSEADKVVHISIMNDCIDALKLCIQRFPLHYKSYHRLAKVYMHDKKFKDLDVVQDLLLGNMGKKKDDKFVAQGLFQDRKHNNFFNGVWRIPVEEIERAGSFGAHMYKTIYLLLQFLHEKRDYNTLYHLHTQLQRNPDLDKKFLKDNDRLTLAGKSMEFAIHSLYKVIGHDPEGKNEYTYAAYLHQAFKWFNYCNKNGVCIPNAQVLLIKAYKAYRSVTELDFDANEKVQVIQAKDFCQQKFSNRNKDKAKAAEPSKPNSAATEASRTQNTLSSAVTTDSLQQTHGDAEDNQSISKSTLPNVRGSFKTFDCERAKKAKVVLAATNLSHIQNKIADTQAAKPHDSEQDKAAAVKASNIASTSWLYKAKEGTVSLASMFDKSAKTD